MGWKNWSYWVMGAILGFGIYIIINLTLFLVDYTTCPQESGACGIALAWSLFILLLLIPFGAIIGKMFGLKKEKNANDISQHFLFKGAIIGLSIWAILFVITFFVLGEETGIGSVLYNLIFWGYGISRFISIPSYIIIGLIIGWIYGKIKGR